MNNWSPLSSSGCDATQTDYLSTIISGRSYRNHSSRGVRRHHKQRYTDRLVASAHLGECPTLVLQVVWRLGLNMLGCGFAQIWCSLMIHSCIHPQTDRRWWIALLAWLKGKQSVHVHINLVTTGIYVFSTWVFFNFWNTFLHKRNRRITVPLHFVKYRSSDYSQFPNQTWYILIVLQ